MNDYTAFTLLMLIIMSLVVNLVVMVVGFRTIIG